MKDYQKAKFYNKNSNKVFDLEELSSNHVKGDTRTPVHDCIQCGKDTSCYAPFYPRLQVIILQCTGAKDNASSLIYEGHWVEVEDSYGYVDLKTGIVVWGEETYCWSVYSLEKKKKIPLIQFPPMSLKVLGFYHEHRDLDYFKRRYDGILDEEIFF